MSATCRTMRKTVKMKILSVYFMSHTSRIVRNMSPILRVGAVKITMFCMCRFAISSVSLMMSISVYGMFSLSNCALSCLHLLQLAVV